jgi:molybdopterin-guanine dinucleotide biosynthesis protein A
MQTLHPIGGVILCGGRSSRMGQAKAWLTLGNETLLQRAVRTLGEVATPIVVVAASDQALPELPAEVEIVRDGVEAEGPLPALILGLQALAGRAEIAFVCACDLPFLNAETIGRILNSLESAEVAAPYTDGYFHPLAAAYRLSLLPKLLDLQAAGERKLQRLFDIADTVRVTIEPETLRNVNTPEDYADALKLLDH